MFDMVGSKAQTGRNLTRTTFYSQRIRSTTGRCSRLQAVIRAQQYYSSDRTSPLLSDLLSSCSISCLPDQAQRRAGGAEQRGGCRGSAPVAPPGQAADRRGRSGCTVSLQRTTESLVGFQVIVWKFRGERTHAKCCLCFMRHLVHECQAVRNMQRAV